MAKITIELTDVQVAAAIASLRSSADIMKATNREAELNDIADYIEDSKNWLTVTA